VDERPGEALAEVPNATEPLTPPEGSATTVAAVLRQRIVDRYQGDHAWYLLNRFLPLVVHYGHLESHNGGRYHSFQWAVILTSPITAFLVGAEALVSNPLAPLLKGAALLAALIVTALTALLHAFNYLTKSVQYRNVKENLVAEFIAMDSAIGQYTGLSDDEKLAQFKTNCESTVHGITTGWAALQTPPQTDKAAG